MANYGHDPTGEARQGHNASKCTYKAAQKLPFLIQSSKRLALRLTLLLRKEICLSVMPKCLPA